MSNTTPTYCGRCAKGFSSPHSRRQHIKDAPQHRRTVDAVQITETYVGVSANEVRRIFSAALRLRFTKPDASTLIRMTGTKVQPEVVAAILEGALRLLPPDNTIDGQRIRKELEKTKAQRSAAAELTFVAHVKGAGFNFMTETEQKQCIEEAVKEGLQPVRSTPDILFNQPVQFHGKEYRWIEYKNTFGFKKNPYLHSKHKKQFHRYVTDFGAGLVVYKLGFEEDLLDIERVDYAREVEVLARL